jgi:hypothetical protein
MKESSRVKTVYEPETPKRKAPYDEKNTADFERIGKNIALALDKIANDPSIPATEQSLANLAGCSRGTLRNRKWPLSRLRQIKLDRKSEAEKAHASPKHQREKTKEEELAASLSASRTEAARWFDKCKDVEADNRKLKRGNELLVAQNEALKAEVARLRVASSSRSQQPANVTRFPDRQSQ